MWKYIRFFFFFYRLLYLIPSTIYTHVRPRVHISYTCIGISLNVNNIFLARLQVLQTTSHIIVRVILPQPHKGQRQIVLGFHKRL